MPEPYIWIPRWKDFQHYRPKRERGPAWIKTYTAQLDDARYLALTDSQRALLHDLRLMFALYRARLPLNRRSITLRRNLTPYQRHLDALNHAGLIEFISRETLEERLEKLYNREREEVLRTSSKRTLESRSNERGSRVPTTTISPAVVLDNCGGCGEVRPLPDDVYCAECLANDIGF
jgi:hypothetical protein